MSFKSPYRMLQGARARREAAMGFLGIPYWQQIINDFGPIAYWQQAEGAGLVAIDLIDNPAQNGTYTGITWPVAPNLTPNGNPSPFFDGINDYNDIFTVAFDAAFDGLEGGVIQLCQVFNAGVWTDGVRRESIGIWDDANNNLYMEKDSVVNQVEGLYEANGAVRTRIAAYNQITWFTMAQTWSDSANEYRFYLNGVQQGVTQAIGTWNGLGLLNDRVLIGTFDRAPVTRPWHGYIGDTIIFGGSAPSPANITAMDTLLRAL